MKPRNPSAFALAVLLFTGAVLLVFWPRLRPAAILPEDPGPLAPAAEVLNVDASIDYYTARLRHEPEAVDHYVSLALVYLQKARTTAQEAAYLPEAEGLLDEALERAPNHYLARVVQASMFNSLHRFEDARDLAHALMQENGRHAYTYGILVDALVELGQYDEAVAWCDSLLALRPSLSAYARAAYLRELHGDTDGALAAMTMAADAGAYGHENRAWALYQLGTLYLGADSLDAAAYIFEGILQERPRYARALGGLGHIAALRGDYDEARRLLDEAYALEPRDVFLEQMMEIATLTGRPAEAARYGDAILEALSDADAMGERVDMETADVLADLGRDLKRALRLAAREYARRPDHLHALETYAWALHHNGRSEEAVPYIRKAMRLGTGDAMVDYRAALIFAEAGLPEEATRHLRRALENNLHIESPSAAQHAQALLHTEA